MSDYAEVVEVVLRWAAALDFKDWGLARTCFLDEVEADYGDLRGGRPERVSSDDFVARRREALEPLLTLHQSTNHRVETSGATATCHSAFAIHRRDASDPQRRYDSFGYYTHRLVHTTGGWKIAHVRQQVLWSEGDPALHSGANAAARDEE